MVTRFKWEVLGCIGYVFCEFAFRWFDRFDTPFNEADWLTELTEPDIVKMIKYYGLKLTNVWLD